MAFSIETRRLSLRLRSPDDAGANLALKVEQGRPSDLTLDDERLRLAEQRQEANVVGIGFLSIRRRGENEVIGYCGLLVGRCTIDEPEIAYELLARAQGRGYATEAAAAVVDAAFATGRRRVWATVRAGNLPSLGVLERLAFRYDRTIADDRGDLIYLERSSIST